MQTVSVSDFKARCLAILSRVDATKQPVMITKRGRPIAQIIPPKAGAPPKRVLGQMKGTGKIVGDIVSPDPELAKLWYAKYS